MQIKRLFYICVLALCLIASASANQYTCLYYGTGCPPGPSGVPGSGDVPQPAAPPPLVPTFLVGVTANSPFGPALEMNSDYFATPETAKAICKRLQCAYVFSRPCVDVSAPFTCSQPQQWLAFKDCYVVNAGILAAYWLRNPEDKFPNVAENAVNTIMANERATKKPSCSSPAQ